MNEDRRSPEEELAALAQMHGPMVYATAYRVVGNAEDAKDAYQDVFLKVLDNWKKQSESVRDWGAYLRVMASRCAIDMLRRNSRWRPMDGDFSERIEAPVSENPRHQATQREKALILRQALASLSERDAKIFALRYFEDLSYEEIAIHLEVSVNAVGTILHRARERLRKILEPKLASNLTDDGKGE